MIYFNDRKIPHMQEIDNPICVITDEEWAKITPNDKLGVEWDIVDGNFILIKETEEYIQKQNEKAQKEEEIRIGNLHMTKLDFYLYVCKPFNITYSQLKEAISQNEDLSAAWELCNHVYRGNEILNNYIQSVIPDITDEILTQIFERYGI